MTSSTWRATVSIKGKKQIRGKPSIILTPKHPKRFLLDECLNIKNKKLLKQLGYVNSKDISKEGISDDELLKKALKENRTIITKDIRFALKTVLLGIQIVYQDHNGIRTLIPKNKPIVIERNCFKRKYDDELTYHLITFDEVIIP